MGGKWPLQRWELEGFRSIRDRVELELGGLNVLVGANSAGKSSLIQSLLLAAQTLGTPLTARTLVLNGSAVQLGLPSDCLNEQAGKSLSFAFQFNVPDDTEPGPAQGARGVNTLDVAVSFDVYGESFEVQELTVQGVVDETGAAEQTHTQEIKFRRASRRESETALRENGLKGSILDKSLGRGIVPVEVSEDSLPLVVAAIIRQFLPARFFELEDQNLVALEALLDLLEETSPEADEERRRDLQRPVRGVTRRRQRGFSPTSHRWLSNRRLRTLEVPPDVTRFLASYLEHQKVDFKLRRREPYTFRELIQLPPEIHILLCGLRGTPWYEEHLNSLPARNDLTTATADEPLDSQLQSARRFFSRNVRHIGPLREEPKPIYGLSEAASGDSVGASGEFTAALLEVYGARPVQCPSAEGGGAFRAPLSEAVNYWLSAMGLLSSVDVQERGKLGYEIRLEIAGVSRSLDLTAVGVGISQALPVIVQGLVSPPGSIVIFEQPELHLHPDVQAAIADFCLALSASGRQVIVETHSEYLVNRLRLRAVEDTTGEAQDLVRLFFVERKDGTSEVRPLRLTSLGGLTEWPVGFLDQAAREAEAIMAAVARRGAES